MDTCLALTMPQVNANEFEFPLAKFVAFEQSETEDVHAPSLIWPSLSLCTRVSYES